MQATQPSFQQRRLWQFHGGIHVPDEKALSNQTPVAAAACPKFLIIPLQQHIGAPASPVVKVGDRVLKGQMIAEPKGYVSAPVHASSSGTVVAIEDRPVPHPSGLSAPCIVIETDGQDAWGELLPPLSDYESLEPARAARAHPLPAAWSAWAGPPSPPASRSTRARTSRSTP